MSTQKMLTNARTELAAWEAIVNERGAVAATARKAHDEAIEARAKWIDLVKSIQSDLGEPEVSDVER